MVGVVGVTDLKVDRPIKIPRPPIVEKQDGMFNLDWLPFGSSDICKRIDGILKPLTIFAPYFHEKDLEEPAPSPDQNEQPIVVSINQEIIREPQTFEELAKYVQKRLVAVDNNPYLSVEEQNNLTAEENRELSRRIAVYLVTVCKKLFKHYCMKAQVLNKRGVFTGPANVSRLKAQLLLDASKFLTVQTIRSYLVEDLKKERVTMGDVYLTQDISEQCLKGISHKTLIEDDRPTSRKTIQHISATAKKQIRQITLQMPTIDTSSLMSSIMEFADRITEFSSSKGSSNLVKVYGRRAASESKLKYEKPIEITAFRKYKSEPVLSKRSILKEKRFKKFLIKKYDSEPNICLLSQEAEAEQDQYEKMPVSGLAFREAIAKDLQNLLHKVENEENLNPEEDDYIPPLIKAIIKSDNTEEKVLQKLKELEKKEQKLEKEYNNEILEQLYPQLAVLEAELPDKTIVRTSDVKPSGRIGLFPFDVQGYFPLFNHITEEIDSTLVKKMDENVLFREELKKLNDQIQDTFPMLHEELVKSPMDLPPTESISISTAINSSLLRNEDKRIVNPEFIVRTQPPWRNKRWEDWILIPTKHNLKDYDVPLINLKPKIPDPSKIFCKQKFLARNNFQEILNNGNFIHEYVNKDYSDWMNWWKNFTNPQDYMKYLFTQDTDYLGAIYHMYSTDLDSEKLEQPEMTKVVSSETSLKPQQERLHETPERLIESVQERLPETPGILQEIPELWLQEWKQDIKKEQKPRGRFLKMVKKMYPGYKKTLMLGDSAKLLNEEAMMFSGMNKLKKLQAIKNEYKPGFWNVNAVMMGGLGKDPEGELETPEISFDRQCSVVTRPVAESSKTLKGRTMMKMLNELNYQERLENVWETLKMPDNMKLDMTIKYSTERFFPKLNKAIVHWENVVKMVEQREMLLAGLEVFECEASDPNRYFLKGTKGLSITRLKEARQRSIYYKKIEYIDEKIKAKLKFMNSEFNDTVTFRGRPYEEKMKWDRIEILYWLQEKRKQFALTYESRKLQIPIKQIHLEPLIKKNSSVI